MLLAPCSTIQKIEALQRRFLWEGGKQTGRKLHLISWEKSSKPLLEGGLNFKNSRIQNLALGEKLLWNIVSGAPTWCKSALWKKYFKGPRERCLESSYRLSKGSPFFTLSKKVLPLFIPHLTWVPRNGRKTKIWNDSILGDPPLNSRQDLRRLENWMGTQNLKTLADISIWGEDRHQSWQGWEVSNLPPDLEGEWGTLKHCLQGKAPLKKKGKDKRGWGINAKEYTTAIGYRLLYKIPTAPENPLIWKAIWHSKSIPKIDLFTWTLAHNNILTGEILQRKGWAGPHRCPLCQQAEETTNHLLLNCAFSKEVWKLTLGSGAEVNLPEDIKSLLQHWDNLYPFQHRIQSQVAALWRILPKFILWNLWLERNSRIFRDRARSAPIVVANIQALFGESTPYICQSNYKGKPDEVEVLWLEQFKIRSAKEITTVAPSTEDWEIRKEKHEFDN
jgi:hypothetical protein